MQDLTIWSSYSQHISLQIHLYVRQGSIFLDMNTSKFPSSNDIVCQGWWKYNTSEIPTVVLVLTLPCIESRKLVVYTRD